MFDFANPDMHSPQRSDTTVPQQALFFMNSPFVTERARALCGRPDVIGVKDGTFLRGLAFAPVTPETRRAGIAGDLFLVVVRRQMWTINEVVRISGPFDEHVRREAGTLP